MTHTENVFNHAARRAVVLLAVVVCVLGPSAARAATTVPMPTVEGPITTATPSGGPWWATPYDLKSHGYVEQEYFLSGVASDRGLSCPPSPLSEFPAASALGCTTGGPVHHAPYKVRILVRRPINRKRFKGTAVLEWANVSLQMEIEHDWAIDAPTMMHEGMISALISAQWIGVQGPGRFSLKNWAPTRYGSLEQPGDAYSFDIYAQAARALRAGLVTHRVKPKVIIGSGTSQSCQYLSTYIKDFGAADDLFDAYMPTLCPITSPLGNKVPVLEGGSESEGGPLPSVPDGPLLRIWEIPGAHINYYEASEAQAQLERAEPGLGPGVWDENDAGQYGERGSPLTGGTLPGALLFGDTMPARYAFRAALHWINRWARDYQRFRKGRLAAAEVRPAPTAPRFARVGNVDRLDANGNVEGGVPTPALEVPVATYEGDWAGVTVPFDAARLLALYPTHDAYVSKMRAATDKAVAGGYMLPADAADWMARVQAARIGGIVGALPAGTRR